MQLFKPRRLVSNVVGLQVFNILRFVTFLIISIVFTKIGLSKKEIGLFEVSVFIASAASFFWVTGLIQSFLPLYKTSETFGDQSDNYQRKSPEIFNAFLLLFLFSLLVFIIGLIIQQNFSVFGYKGNVPLLNATLFYLFLSSPACMVEYIYMVRNQSGNTLSYAYITYTIQLAAVLIPVLLGYDIVWALWGLVGISALRNLWLFSLLYNYAEFKISIPFMKEHLKLAAPLFVTVFVSSSAQYIDGIMVSSHFSAKEFAIFRYGAKEMPFLLMLTNGLGQAMLTEFSKKDKIQRSLVEIKKRSLRIMHYMYPLSILLLLFAKPFYSFIFSPEFTRSADVFVVYLLAIFSRILFPHTILNGMKKTRTLFRVSIVEFFLNLGLSLWFVQIYGVTGVAVATILAYFLSKLVLVIYNYVKLGIHPGRYIPIKWYVFYSTVLLILFILIDHRVFIIGG